VDQANHEESSLVCWYQLPWRPSTPWGSPPCSPERCQWISYLLPSACSWTAAYGQRCSALAALLEMVKLHEVPSISSHLLPAQVWIYISMKQQKSMDQCFIKVKPCCKRGIEQTKILTNSFRQVNLMKRVQKSIPEHTCRGSGSFAAGILGSITSLSWVSKSGTTYPSASVIAQLKLYKDV